VRVGVFSARFLGEAVANIIAASGAEIVARHHDSTGWWGTAGTDHRDDVFGAEPDLVVSVLTQHIFTPSEIERVPKGIVNLHPAPLPELRGCNSYSHAIINGHTEYGVTLHYVDAGIDTGQIIRQKRWQIGQRTARELHDIAQLMAVQMFAEAWPTFASGYRAASEPQLGPATYYPRTSLEPYRDLGWHPPQHRDRIRRALTFPPFPMPREP